MEVCGCQIAYHPAAPFCKCPWGAEGWRDLGVNAHPAIHTCTKPTTCDHLATEGTHGCYTGRLVVEQSRLAPAMPDEEKYINYCETDKN